MSTEKSTIVRAMRLMYGTLEAVAPAPGGVLAERLWCAIPRGKPVTAARPGERFTLRVGPSTVVAEMWGEGPTVYLLHGWGGRRAQLDSFVAPLVAAGHRVVSLDAPSHGESTPGRFGPRRALLIDFIDALAAAIAATGPAHAVIGHSGGGHSAAMAALDGIDIGRLVTIGAMADPGPYTVEFAAAVGFGDRIRTRLLRRLERRVGRLMSDFDVPTRAAASTALPPAMIVHDQQDKEVHYADAEQIAGGWPGARLVTTTGLGHRRILHDPAVIERVVAFLAPVGAAQGSPAQ